MSNVRTQSILENHFDRIRFGCWIFCHRIAINTKQNPHQYRLTIQYIWIRNFANKLLAATLCFFFYPYQYASRFNSCLFTHFLCVCCCREIECWWLIGVETHNFVAFSAMMVSDSNSVPQSHGRALWMNADFDTLLLFLYLFCLVFFFWKKLISHFIRYSLINIYFSFVFFSWIQHLTK